MNLRSISLKDIRRFTDPIRIDGIADGVNVLSAPNEFGKSTVFDALRALFFVPYGSRAREITQLRPYAGGAPEVSVDLETADGVFVVSKRWFSKPEARVMRAGTLVAQADEAEAWISRLLGGGDGGPSGLLWVRQGITGLGEGSNKEQQAALDARRDLLSSVTGEVEAMTGGRRMDIALESCRKDLEAYASSTGRPKAHGPWKTAIDDVDELRATRDHYAGLVTVLQTALNDRSRMRRDLADLEAPEIARERAERLTSAKAAHDAAQAHAAKAQAAGERLQAVKVAAERASNDLETLRLAAREQETALAKEKDAREQLRNAEDGLAVAETFFSEISVAHDAAEAERKRAEEILRKLEAKAAAETMHERRTEIEERLARALNARQAVETIKAQASVGPDDSDMEMLRRLSGALTTARALRDSTATRVVMRYASGREGSTLIDGAPLGPGVDMSIHSDTVLQIRNVGELTIHPGEGPRGAGDVEKAEADLAQALSAFGCPTLEEAAAAHGKRKEASERLTRAHADLAALAPNGIEELQRQLTALPKPVEIDGAELPTPQEATAATDKARSRTSDLGVKLEAARERRGNKRMASAEAAVRLETALERLAAAHAALERLPSHDQGLLAEKAQEAVAAEQRAGKDLEKISANAPDLEAAEAALARAQSVEDGARKKIENLRPALAALDERIASNSGDAVEERLQETEEKLEEAEKRLARIEHEVRVLQRLQTALEDARSQARDRYFAPIAGELRPLLNLLWPDAELNWADDTLLPQSLTRNGQEEPLDILSGGTQEQIALLVRLAFARLLAKDGRHAPVILDDALVFTDDDRIERMFDALHRQASDLQIIVLSCRQRAFRVLGGTALEIIGQENRKPSHGHIAEAAHGE